MEYISIKELIKILQEKKINLGKGDPYNRLRYYTKIGWLPHMIRKKDENGEIVGHYHYSVIGKLEEIEKYKNQNKSNEEIEKILNIKKNDQKINIYKIIYENIRKININTIFIILILVGFIVESMRYSSLNEKIINNKITEQEDKITEKRISDSGIGIIPSNQKTIFIPSSRVTPTSIILLNFIDNIGYSNNYFIKEKITGEGYYVEIGYSLNKESRFNWIIIE